MKNCIRAIVSGLLPVLCFIHLQAQPALKPNILWLIAEDISPYIKAYGDSTAHTPNLDRLWREGIRYTRCFDVSGVCAPSRSALITGMYPTSVGTNNMRTGQVLGETGLPPYSVVLPPEVKMFSEWMRAGGYYCSNNDKQDYQFKAPRSGWDESSKTAHWRNRPKGKPFFAVFTLGVTHESQIWVKKDDPLLVDPAKVKLPPYYPESPAIRKDMARMYSNIVEMDKQVGELLQQLKEDGELENTIIIWNSDNGGPVPRGKREIYDTGIRIPLLIRFPNKQLAGTTNEELVSFVDFAPSMLSLAGLPIPAYMQGQAFLGNSRSSSPRKYIYAARDRMDSEYDLVRAVRDKRFKYIRNYQPEKPFIQEIAYRKQMDLMLDLLRLEKEGKLNAVQQLWFRKTKPVEELYDTEKDPYELNNLAIDKNYTSKLEELKAALNNWIDYTQDKGFIAEKKWVEMMWPGMVQPVTEKPVFLKDGAIAIRSATAGASISWQLVKKGDTANEKQWQLYTRPVAVPPGQQLMAVAERIGYKPSDMAVIDGAAQAGGLGNAFREMEQVPIRSSADNAVQNAYFYRSKSKTPKPLVVSLHTWSGNYAQKDTLAILCREKDFNYIHPDFRGSNTTPAACASDLAVSDMDDAIAYAIANGNVDKSRIFVIGVSGGGYATLTMYMRSKYKIQKFSAWASITDLSAWYKESVERKNEYAANILACTVSQNGILNEVEAKKRSPLYRTLPVQLRNSSTLNIYAGVHDGFTGSVPITHSIGFYNKLLKELGAKDPALYVSAAEKNALIQTRKPLGNFGAVGDRTICLKKQYKGIQLVIFDGGHEMLSAWAFETLTNN